MIFGKAPNPAKKKVSKIEVLEKRNNIYIYRYIDDFVEGSQPWQKKTTSKIIVPEQRNFFLGGRLPTLEKTAALKIIVPEKRNYMSRSVPNAQRKASSKIIVPEKEELVF